RTSFDFQTGHETVAYLRSRGVVAPDAAGPIDLDQLAVTPQFLIARQIELGPLMDLAATFLDALDLVHDIYGADHDGLAYASADLVPGEHPTHS
ncbi:MAG TPA: hypothetical protein VFY92_05415, partial [Hyphomicrobiaceae bacterium]|nr:hypothetical protein [Hyphomicrobiaceae bacterium]